MSGALAPAPVVAPPAGAAPATRTFLPYLEGIRGFFSLYIAVAHAWLRAAQLRPGLFPDNAFVSHFVAFSHSAIGMFIVISGYVLGLPVARRGQRLSGGLRTFFVRRALRLLPAYYAALLVAIPVAFIAGPRYDEQLTPHAFIVSTLLHLGLLQNISNTYIDTLNAPMWSIAVECDIYIVFAFVLVPLARRFGFVTMVAAAFALGFAPTLLGIVEHRLEGYRLSESCLWYIGLFALGYAAANFHVSRDSTALARLQRWPWTFVAATLALLALATIAVAKPYDMQHGTRWPTDVLIGLAIAAQFTADAQARARGRVTWFERFFLWRPLLVLGAFSYSFYLVHLPIIDLIVSRTPAGISNVAMLATAAVAVVIALGVAYAFFLAFERPFMTGYRRAGDAASLLSSRPADIADAPRGVPAAAASGKLS